MSPVRKRKKSGSRACPAVITAMLIVLLTAAPGRSRGAGGEIGSRAESEDVLSGSSPDRSSFARSLDLESIRILPVFHGGRVKILDTLAREVLSAMSGRSHLEDPRTGDSYDPLFSYLDLVFNRDAYREWPLVYVKNRDLRKKLVEPLPDDLTADLVDGGRFAPALFAEPALQDAILDLQGEAIMMNALGQVSLSLESFLSVGREMLLVPPEPGSERWLHIEQVAGGMAAGGAGLSVSAGSSVRDQVLAAYTGVKNAWRDGDPNRVNLNIGKLSRLLTVLETSHDYPGWKRTAELYYNRTARFTFGYAAYLVAFVLFLLALATQRRRLLRAGMICLGAGFVIHTLGMVTRIAISGRPWAIHNQFESFFMLSWFSVLIGAILLLTRKQWIFGVASSVVGAAALLIINTVPIPSSDIAPVAAILMTSRILYVHVNIMIMSYALISLGFIVSCFYLVAHYVRPAAGLELSTEAVGRNGPGREVDAGSGSRMLRDLDRAQMVILRLVFWFLIVGILLGAYWADHSWGRWWAWDPKETWALMTWFVYLSAVHLRFTVRRPALVNAWMSVAGFFMMLWTHWGVNLLLAGLHSYA